MKKQEKIIKEINKVIDKMRPYLINDGGDVEFVNTRNAIKTSQLRSLFEEGLDVILESSDEYAIIQLKQRICRGILRQSFYDIW